MAFISWSSSYSVGVAMFDKEHQGLIGLINELHDSMYAGKSKDVLDAILNRLIKYTVEHFEHEEVELKRAGYPQLREHHTQHEKLKAEVAQFRARLSLGYNGLIAIEMLKFLKNWLVQHIQHEDKLYGKFLNAKGVR